MLKTLINNIILAPGHFVANLINPKKRKYRSARKHSNITIGVIGFSAAIWGLLFFILFSFFSAKQAEEINDLNTENMITLTENLVNTTPTDIIENVSSLETNDTLQGQISNSLQNNLQTPIESNIQNPENEIQFESWLLILNTVPKNIKKGDEKERRNEAERLKKNYEKKGIVVEIFDTDAYTKLIGGNWIVAQGPFNTKIEAEIAAGKIQSVNKHYMIRRGL